MADKVTLNENSDGQLVHKGNELFVEAKNDDAAAIRGGAPKTQRTLVKICGDVVDGERHEEVGQFSFKQSETNNVVDGRLGGEFYLGLRIPGMGSTDAAMQDLLRAYPKDTHPDYPGGAFVFEVPVVAPNLGGGPVAVPPGGTPSAIQSPNGRYRLQCQDDGHVVFYDMRSPSGIKALWSSRFGVIG